MEFEQAPERQKPFLYFQLFGSLKQLLNFLPKNEQTSSMALESNGYYDAIFVNHNGKREIYISDSEDKEIRIPKKLIEQWYNELQEFKELELNENAQFYKKYYLDGSEHVDELSIRPYVNLREEVVSRMYQFIDYS